MRTRIMLVIAILALTSCRKGLSRNAPDGPIEVEPVLVAGDDHTCLLTGKGKVKCWGGNYAGKLGDGTSDDRTSAVEVKGLGRYVTRISAGDYHTCAVEAGGKVKCWGHNEAGQLGNGKTDECMQPVEVQGLTAPATQISAAGDHTCALLDTRKVMCWGGNSLCELGDGTSELRTKPTSPKNLVFDLACVSSGKSHTCVVDTGGNAKCWGSNVNGEIGIGWGTPMVKEPKPVLDDARVRAIVAGDGRTCALLESGEASCWGSSLYGLCGDGKDEQKSSTPTVMKWAGNRVGSVALGRDHGCVLLKGGSVKCWGANVDGQLGSGGSDDPSPTPIQVEGLESGVTQIAAGTFHTCALLDSGQVRCWGFNASGQLGDGTKETRKTPVQVKGV